MLQPLAESGAGAMEVAAGEISFKRSGADGDAIELNRGAGRGAGDFRVSAEEEATKQKGNEAKIKERRGGIGGMSGLLGRVY